MSEMEQVKEFLSSPRADLRQAALNILLGLSGNDKDLKILLQADLIKSLCRLLGDVREIAEISIKILINLTACQDTAVIEALNCDVIHRIMNQMDEKDWRLKDLSLMILANVTVVMQGAIAVVKDKKCGALLLEKLTGRFMETEPEPEGVENGEPVWDDEYQYVGNILANITQTAEGRAFLLQNRNGKSLLSVLLPQVQSVNVVRRRGMSNTIRNLAFETDFHYLLYAELDTVQRLMLLLAGPEELNEYDVEGMPSVVVKSLGAGKVREMDSTVRAAIVDTFVLLCTTRNGRQFLRKIKVYPIVREAHLVEDKDDIGEQIHKLVGLLMRDEEGEEPDWNEVRKQSMVEEVDTVSGKNEVMHKGQDLPVLKKEEMVEEPEEEDISDELAAGLMLELEAIDVDTDEEDEMNVLD